MTAWTMENAGYPVTADYLESCMYHPQIEVDEKLWGKRIDWYRKWITSTDRSDEYWNTGFWKLLKDIPSRVKIPLYIGEGWYDHHLASAIETYQSLSEECREKSRFLVGAWEHGPSRVKIPLYIGEGWYDHHLASAIETYQSLSEECREKSRFLVGAWEHGFNVKLEDVEGTHFENDDILRTFYWFWDILVEKKQPEAKIDYYVIGEDCWYSRKKFEIKDQKKLRLYISDDSDSCKIISDKTDVYKLKRENNKSEGKITWKFDPNYPVKTHGAESLLVTKEEQGSLRQHKPGYRKDVVSCISEPFEESITVLGKMQVVLTVATDVEDTAFVAKIMEVRPNGEAYNMRTGIYGGAS